jgi:hypothetical protein
VGFPFVVVVVAVVVVVPFPFTIFPLEIPPGRSVILKSNNLGAGFARGASGSSDVEDVETTDSFSIPNPFL